MSNTQLLIKKDTHYDGHYFSILPVEILFKIFNLCEVREQLTLSKITKHFQQIIKEIFKRKFKSLQYNHRYFKCSLNLNDLEIRELCRLCSDFVVHICLVALYTSRFCYTSDEDITIYLKFHQGFLNNIQYFRNLLELEITGNEFPEETVLELAKYCKKIRSLSFIANENIIFQGKYLQDLECIENLNLQNCFKINFNYLLALSQKRHLKCLNVLGCSSLLDITNVIKLCDHWLYVETLTLFASSSDEKFLNAIINLPSLNTLHLYWNVKWRKMSNFEEIFLHILSKHKEKALKLKHIRLKPETFWGDIHKHFIPKQYAIANERLYALVSNWQWPKEVFKKIFLDLAKFTNLQSINFSYCRPLSNEHIIKLAKLNRLELIKIVGCPKSEDGLFKKQWSEDKTDQKRCQLELESILTLTEVKEIYDKVSMEASVPPERTILCQFS